MKNSKIIGNYVNDLLVREAFCLFSWPNKLNNSKKLLMPIKFFLLFQNKHEMVAIARLHHNPVYSSWQINVCGQENYVFTWRKTKDNQMNCLMIQAEHSL